MELEALPKGFRFRPTDEELIGHYLRHKINGHHSSVEAIPEVDVCKKEPWDLPALSVIKSDDPEWFFFCPRDKKYPNGHRSNRATEAGYWKATGKDRSIKSRKSLPSSRSITQLIGMKKTLVFHKGRAPKGERTNWIMHEYRATEPDLDGSGPGQGDYVLCRLFHKEDAKPVTSNYDEVEPTGSSPSTGKLSPDEVTSDLSEEPVVLVIDIKESEDVKKQCTHETDHYMMQLPIGRRESNVSGHLEDKAVTEVYVPLQEIQEFQDPNNKASNTLRSYHTVDSRACIDSPLEYDFGYGPNGLHFQDGTFEPDAPLSDLLKDLPNFDNNCYVDSTARLNCGVSKCSLMPSQINRLEQAPTAFFEGNYSQIHDRADTRMAGSQYPNLEEQSSAAFLQVNPSTDQYVFEENWHTNELTGSHCQVDDSFSDSRRIEGGRTPGIVPAIKIRSRQPQSQPHSLNIATQGTALRRIHLPVKCGSNSFCSVKFKDANSTKEKESQLLTTEADKNINKTCKSCILEHGHLDGTKVTAQSYDRSLEAPVKHDDKKGCAKLFFMPSSALHCRKGATFMNVYVVSIYFVIIMSVVFIGLWSKCPGLSLSAPYN